MFSYRYFPTRYFAQRYFPATPAAEGSLSATASGHAIVVATLSAAGLAQAGLLGAGAVAAWISSGCGFIGAALFGVSSLNANVSAMGALQPAPSIVLSWGRARATTYTSLWNAPPAVGFRVSAAARIVTPHRQPPRSAKDRPQKNRSPKQRVSLARELKCSLRKRSHPQSPMTKGEQRFAWSRMARRYVRRLRPSELVTPVSNWVNSAELERTTFASAPPPIDRPRNRRKPIYVNGVRLGRLALWS